MLAIKIEWGVKEEELYTYQRQKVGMIYIQSFKLNETYVNTITIDHFRSNEREMRINYIDMKLFSTAIPLQVSTDQDLERYVNEIFKDCKNNQEAIELLNCRRISYLGSKKEKEDKMNTNSKNTRKRKKRNCYKKKL